jgi:hypothetical protein
MGKYIVKPANKAASSSVVNPRRGPTVSVPGMSMANQMELSDIMFQRFGFDELVGCITAEPYSRHIPQVFQSSEVSKLTELYASYIQEFLSTVLEGVMAPFQTYNKYSRIGYPIFANPENKQAVLEQMFEPFQRGDFSLLQGSYTIMNVRLQAEDKNRKRNFQFITSDGKVYDKEVGMKDRLIKVFDKKTGEFVWRVASHRRLTFNYNGGNLFKQIIDTMVHDSLLKHPIFHHDMYGKKFVPITGHHVCTDVSHYERFVAGCVDIRAKLFGGNYEVIHNTMRNSPFLVPSDDWEAFYFISPNREEGWQAQFGSGDSAVAPVAKEMEGIKTAEFFVQNFGMTRSQAIMHTLRGGDSRLNFRNYGDDMSLSGEKSLVEEYQAFVNEYIPTKEEHPPKFLGFVYWPDGRWLLGASSYLEKTYLNERAPGSYFRKYPYFGWTERRKIYTQYGDPMITTDIYPFENEEFKKFDFSWEEVLTEASNDMRRLSRVGIELNRDFVMGKDYRMSADDKMKSGNYFGFAPDKTAGMCRTLLDRSWKGVISWL